MLIGQSPPAFNFRPLLCRLQKGEAVAFFASYIISGKYWFLSLAVISAFFFVPAQAHSLTPIEKQISHFITQQQNEQLLLLEKLVNINSGTLNAVGVRSVGNILQSQLAALGFSTRWREEPAMLHRAGTLIAEHRGNRGKRILLIGHLDTVFSSSHPFQTFKRQGNTATGPGVIDDKGGDVIILYALKALQAAHVLENARITVILTGDEEDSGKPTAISRKPLLDAAKQSDVALDFEWAITANTATIARRGVSGWILETKGTEAHSAGIFQVPPGDGAVFEMARILNAMRVQLSGQAYLSFNPGLMLGGSTIHVDRLEGQGTARGKDNIIAKTAMVKGDLRFLSVAQQANTKKQMMTIVQQHLPGTTASIYFQDGIPAMPPTANNLAMLSKYSQVSDDLGYGKIKPLDPGKRGAGDISYVAHQVTSNLVGLGAVGTGAHSTAESLAIDSLSMQTKRAALLIYRLSLE